MQFQELNLIKPLLAAVKCCGYTEPTPIQRKTIPPVLEGRSSPNKTAVLGGEVLPKR